MKKLMELSELQAELCWEPLFLPIPQPLLEESHLPTGTPVTHSPHPASWLSRLLFAASSSCVGICDDTLLAT